jgi:hypothetical protein
MKVNVPLWVSDQTSKTASVALGMAVLALLVACGGGTSDPATLQGSGTLPDTGIGAAQCFQEGSDELVSCSSAGAKALNDQQDGMVGLDVAAFADADSDIASRYQPLGAYPLTDCVKDGVTGLIWEGKPSTGTRAAGNTYVNFNGSLDGKTVFTSGELAYSGDVGAYVLDVNSSKLCGYSDWRLPTVNELQGLVNYGVAEPKPMIDATWFVNTPPKPYWSSSDWAKLATDYAWNVQFDTGMVDYQSRGYPMAVRLVR